MAEKNSPGTTGSAPASNGTGSAPGSVAGKPANGIPAAPSVATYGGNRGGKPRKDGLVPGSEAAIQADKDTDAKRKRDARAAEKLAEPPPLPVPAAGGSGPGPAPANGSSSVPGVAGALQNDSVPWDPADLRPLLDEVIEQSEQSRIENRRSRANAVGLPERVVNKVCAGAVFPKTAKTALARCGSNGTAKLMNSLGVSGKYSDVAIAMTAVTAILVSIRRSDAEFEEIIAEFKKGQAPKSTNGKP